MIGDAWLDSSPSPAPLLCGLARNPATPVPVLLRMVEGWPEQVCAGMRRRGDLPGPVQEAMLRHHSPRIRGVLAAHPQVDPAMRAVLVFDPQWRVRVCAFGHAGQRPLPDPVLTRLLADLDDPPPRTPATADELIGELLEAMRYDPRPLRLAAVHPRAGLRERAARLIDLLDEPTQHALLNDPQPHVRQAAADSIAYRQQVMQPGDLPAQHCHAFWHVLQRRLSRALVEQVLRSGDVAAIGFVAANPSTPPDVVQTLLSHPDPWVR
jgi:hypothetical protein